VNARAAIGTVAVVLLGCAPPAGAARIALTEVTQVDNRYEVTFDVRLAAPADRLQHYLTDYANYASYFDSVAESTVLSGEPGGLQRVRLRLRSCVLFFCRTVTFVKEVAEQADGEILARIDPSASDFREATETWRITPAGNETRLQYRAELVPDFFVPPLIGPWLLKHKIRSALVSGAEKLEALARR
jgi:hypothetical protein